jgi:hypothetical protein
MRHDIAQMKQRGPLPVLMEWLGAGQHAHKSAWCPFHENTKDRAFSIYETDKGWKWKCHSQCGGGDELDFIERYEQRSRHDAIERYSQLTGVLGASYCAPVKTAKPQVKPALPTDFHKGNREELQTVATLRKVGFWAVATMQQNGVLGFGTVCGLPCWIITDHSRRCAEARRLDGGFFPAFPGGSERKVHTLKGFSKQWAVGLSLPNDLNKHFNKVLLVEGSGDLLAAYHFAHEAGDWLPVAMLGGGLQIPSIAHSLIRGKRVKIVPHIDIPKEGEERGEGEQAADNWAEELCGIGCEVYEFNLRGLRKIDGSRINDLNDCTQIHTEDAAELEGLLK